MEIIILVGFLAAACTTLALLPQIIKSWKTKQTKDISLGMYLVFDLGLALWLIYGLVTKDLPLLIANIISFILASSVLYLKFKYK